MHLSRSSRTAIFHDNLLQSFYGRGTAEHRKVPQRLRRAVDALRHVALHQHQLRYLNVRHRRQRRVHGHAQRAAFFSAGKLRTIGLRRSVDRLLRQPLAVDVDGLLEAGAHHKEQTRIRQYPQPERMRVLDRSAFDSFDQVFSSVEKRIQLFFTSMT